MPAKRRDDLAEGAAGESGDIADAAFDAWLRRGLHALFGQPDDALPDALLRII